MSIFEQEIASVRFTVILTVSNEMDDVVFTRRDFAVKQTGRCRRENLDVGDPGFDQRLEAATNDCGFLFDRQVSGAIGLSVDTFVQ